MFDKLKKSLNQYSNVEEISGGFDHLGVKNSTSLLKQQEKEYEISTLSIDPNYLSLVGLEMAAGREFIPNSTADRNGMIVNEKFVSQLSLANPLELEYEIDSTKYTIIGVVKDFHFNSFQSAVEPMVFLVGEEENF